MNALYALALSIGAVVSVSTKPANFAGTWTLDRARSTGLPGYYANVKRHTLRVTQDETRLNVAVEIDAGQPTPDHVDFVYPLDGTTTRQETTIRGPQGAVKVPTTNTSTVSDDGVVHITTTREIPMGDTVIKASSTEDWLLSADGGTLTVHRADDGPRGRMVYDMVFARAIAGS